MIKNLFTVFICFISCLPISLLLIKCNLVCLKPTEKQPDKTPPPPKRKRKKYSIALNGAKEEVCCTYKDD